MQWTVTVGGREMTFTGEVSPNGKVVVRRDARIVAPPLAPGEAERVFTVDGEQLRLRRSGEALDLEVIPRMPLPPLPRKRRVRQWIDENLGEPVPPPRGVVLRARVYFVAALIIFLTFGLWATTLLLYLAIGLHQELLVTIEGGIPLFVPVALRLIPSLLRLTSLAMLGMIAAVFLWRGYRWASLVLELVTWLMLIVLMIAAIRADRELHVQVYSNQTPAIAAQEIDYQHKRSLSEVLLMTLVTGGMLQLVGRRSVDRLYGAVTPAGARGR